MVSTYGGTLGTVRTKRGNRNLINYERIKIINVLRNREQYLLSQKGPWTCLGWDVLNLAAYEKSCKVCHLIAVFGTRAVSIIVRHSTKDNLA